MSIWITALVNAIEKKSIHALIAFIISFGVWVLYGLKVYSAGIAIPEIISFTAVAVLLLLSVIKIFFKK
ncbi:MAG: hypothetical protein JSV76_03235 [Candidatus Bathyarchaeota archaeon]|nr:MAG: hypothetical protein JSV76_03235 [Candidatus Bathyarchaeota archaeon]